MAQTHIPHCSTRPRPPVTSPNVSRPVVAVVGAGISGLAAAHRLVEEGTARAVLLEGRERLGGVIRTDEIDGVLVEAGPDAFVAGGEIAALCESAGIPEGDLVAPAVFGAYIWSRGRVRKLPAEVVFGLPGAPLSIARRGLLSPPGAMRALADLVLPGPLAGPDVAVGQFIGRRMGREVVQRLVDPLLAGRRAGYIETMSLAAADDRVDELARSHRSLILGLRQLRRSGALESGPPAFRAPRGGMERLVEGLLEKLEGVEVRTGAFVEGVGHAAGGRYRVRIAEGPALEADAVIVAIPAPAAAGLMSDLSDPAARELRTIRFADTAVATFLFPPGAATVPGDGSGFLVPKVEGRGIAACTWYSHKWPSSAPPDGGSVLRAFVGRSGREAALELDDDRLAGTIAAELSDAMAIEVSPRAWRVTRWNSSLPEYTVGHGEKVDRIREALKGHPRVALAGAAYAGSGIPDCVKSGRAAASEVIEGLKKDEDRLVSSRGKDAT
jgi:protoporphyrinogen/coproporphyrinogen III oxidase